MERLKYYNVKIMTLIIKGPHNMSEILSIITLLKHAKDYVGDVYQMKDKTENLCKTP